MNERYLSKQITKDLEKKMVFIAGPRQVGKTTFAQSIPSKLEQVYLNWDFDEDRQSILEGKWPLQSCKLILDEIHKYKNWRQLVKGLFDKRKNEIKIIVTGSAKLDYYRHGGDSLQGRYFHYRLHPLSVAELNITKQEELENLLIFSGFPEPYLSQDLSEKNRWSRAYRSRLINEEIRDLERINEIYNIEKLSIRLPEMVSSPLSISSLSRDLSVAYNTVARWCDILERMYYIFRLYPFQHSKVKSLKKEAKHYHYDWTLPQEIGAKYENLIASHLLKWVDYQVDTKGRDLELNYMKDLDGLEIDFVVTENKKPLMFIESKVSIRETSKALKNVIKKFPQAEFYQLHWNGEKEFKNDLGVNFMKTLSFLKNLV